jgi:hypothetical protein
MIRCMITKWFIFGELANLGRDGLSFKKSYLTAVIATGLLHVYVVLI